MTRLPAAQLRRLNHTILVLHEEIAGPQPLEAIIDLIDSLLPVPWITVDEVELATGRMEHRSSRRPTRTCSAAQGSNRSLLRPKPARCLRAGG